MKKQQAYPKAQKNPKDLQYSFLHLIESSLPKHCGLIINIYLNHQQFDKLK
jgi:hypothetical protein